MWKPAYNLTRSRQPKPSARRLEQMRNYWRTYAERKTKLGLTTRGTVPKRRLESRLLLAELDALAADIAGVFHDAPPTLQARLLQMEIKMAAVRRKLA